MLRIPYEEMFSQFKRVLLKTGFTPERAELCARMFAKTSLDGVYSHGLNRFPRFIQYIGKGYVDIHGRPELVSSSGALETWDGNSGPGNLNAYFCMNRAMELAAQNGIGCVALKNTNHWMRAGTYGWQAAEAGFIGICWTNTMPNMPPWGAVERKLGNNPIVFAVPRSEGHIVLDMAMTQFSYGKMEVYKFKNEPLPVDGGFDREGNLTRDPAAILDSARPLPIGYWKGSGLSLLLDLVAMVLSGGKGTFHIGKTPDEYGLSQVFIAIAPSGGPADHMIKRSIAEVIDDLHSSTPDTPNGKITYPGERTILTRMENLQHGIPVEEAIWKQVLEM